MWSVVDFGGERTQLGLTFRVGMKVSKEWHFEEHQAAKRLGTQLWNLLGNGRDFGKVICGGK